MADSRPSTSSAHPRLSLAPPRPGFRRLSGFSVSDHGGISSVDETPPEIPAAVEDINEIKRYEDFTTIDWVQDGIYEQARRRAKRRYGTGFWDKEGTLGWRRKLRESYDAGQAWLVVTIVGVAIGLNAAFLNIVTEWLSDIKLGHCSTAFYLNEQFCCWGVDDGMDTNNSNFYSFGPNKSYRI
jgi:chloride channel 3/4/5